MSTLTIDSWFASLAERRWSEGNKRRSGAWSSAWREIAANDPTLSTARVTVEIVFGGDVVVRAATEPIETRSSTSGEVYRYAPLLQAEPVVTSEISLSGGSASLRSVSLSLDGRLVDPLAIVNGGRMLAGFGEVALQVDGGDWDDRIVLLRGDMAGGVSFGATDEILDFEIVDQELTADRLIPPAVLTLAAWPSAREGDLGRRFPLVLSDHPSVPCLRLSGGSSACSYAVCLDDGYSAGSAYVVESLIVEGVSYPSTSSLYPWAQASEVDSASGARLVTVSVSASIDESVEVYATIALASGRSPSLIDIVRTLLVDHSIVGNGRIDYDLLGATETRLALGLAPKVLINGSGSGDATRAIEYLESTIANDFPMLSFAWTGNGYAPAVVDRRRGLYVADLRRAQYPLIDRLSSISESPKGDLQNSFALRYAYDLVEGSHTGVEVRDSSTSLICRISEEAIGRRDGGVVEAATVYDSETAAYIVDWQVEHLALPHYVVEYEGFSVLAFTLRLGDNIYLSDDLLGWERVPATVLALTYQRGRAVVRLAVWLLYANLPGGARSGRGVVGGGGGGQVAGAGGNNAAPAVAAQPGAND
jgi:hypothetical protein